MVDEGCEHSKHNQTSAGKEVKKAAIYPTGVGVKVQELVSLLAQRKGTSILVAVDNLCLVVALHPLVKASVRAFTC